MLETEAAAATSVEASGFEVSARAKDAPFRIAVIGAGPVGLAAAAALAAIGSSVSVHVYDREPSQSSSLASAAGCTDGADGYPSPGQVLQDGRALEMWPNAVAALGGIRVGGDDLASIMFDVRAGIAPTNVGYPLERYDFRSAAGRLLWGAPTGSIGRRLLRAPRVLSPQQLKAAVERAVQEASLTRHPGWNFVKGEVSSNSTKPHAKLTFEVAGGRRTVFADMVVAADGASSAVRSEMRLQGQKDPLLPQTGLRPSRVLAIVGRTQGKPAHGITSRGIGFVSHVQDARFGAWACPEDPANAVRWLALVPAEDLFEEESRRPDGSMKDAFDDLGRPRLDGAQAGKLSEWLGKSGRREELRKRLRDRLAELAVPSLKLIDTAELASLRLFTLYDEPPSRDAWFGKCVVLLGDAVHPTLPDLGQGCGLAFEDAEALGRLLGPAMYAGGAWSGVADQLEAWVEERHVRSVWVVQMTRMLAEAVHASREPQGVRDALVTALGPATVLPTLTSIISYEPPRA